MKKGWETKKLDDACEVEYGTRVVNKRDGGSKYPVYGGGGATFFMDEFNREDRMVIARFAMSEQCTRFVKGKFFLNDSGLTVTPKNKSEIREDFFDYLMFSLNDFIYSLGRGTAQKNLDVSAFRNIEISYPKSLPEQQRIVALLDEAFASISQTKDNAERNLLNARELFESVSREIFEGDKGWDKKLLGDVCKVDGEITRDIDSALPYIGADSIESDTGRLIQKKSVLEQGIRGPVLSFSGKKLLYSKIRPYLNKLTISNFKGYCSSDMYPLKFEKSVLYEYAQHYLLSKRFLNSISGFYQRAAIPKINRNDLFSVSIPVPPLAEQRAIVERLEALSAETKRLEEIYQRKVVALEELKKSVLQKAFEGEL